MNAKAVIRATQMNGTERAYADYLWQRQLAGEVLRYDFEAEKLRLADNTFYTPDFRVVLADLSIEMHEVKGFWQDDARVKIKVAAQLHPYRFIGVRKVARSWEFEEF